MTAIVVDFLAPLVSHLAPWYMSFPELWSRVSQDGIRKPTTSVISIQVEIMTVRGEIMSIVMKVY